MIYKKYTAKHFLIEFINQIKFKAKCFDSQHQTLVIYSSWLEKLLNDILCIHNESYTS